MKHSKKKQQAHARMVEFVKNASGRALATVAVADLAAGVYGNKKLPPEYMELFVAAVISAFDCGFDTAVSLLTDAKTLAEADCVLQQRGDEVAADELEKRVTRDELEKRGYIVTDTKPNTKVN